MKFNATWQVAFWIADMMEVNQVTRARISDKTLKLLAGRRRLDGFIRSAIATDLAEYDYAMISLNNGRGNAIIKMSTLEGTKQLTLIGTYPDEKMREEIITGSFDYDSLMTEYEDNEPES